LFFIFYKDRFLSIARSDCSPVKGSSKHVLHVGVSVSYEDGKRHEDNASVLTPQPKNEGTDDSNSYKRYEEMMQQQEQ